MAARPLLFFAWSLVAGTALAGQEALAATECEQNYTAKPNPAGGTIHQSFVGLYDVDPAKAMTGLEQSANKIDFVPVANSQVGDDGLITTVVAQRATNKARGFPIVLMVSPRTKSAIVAYQLAKGVQSPGARGNICSFFDAAGLKGTPSNASGAMRAQNDSMALPLLAAFDDAGAIDRASDEIAKAIKAAGVSVTDRDKVASEKADTRGAPPEEADPRKVLKPKTTFDPAAVDAHMLSEGTATIRGFVCGGMSAPDGGRFRTTPNQSIILFPYNAYVKETIDLVDSNRYKGNKVRVDFDKRAFDVRLEGKTNGHGDFQFSRLKPGRYLVVTIFSGTTTTASDRLQSSYDPSRNTVYEWTTREETTTVSAGVLQADVTVERDGQVVDGVIVKAKGNGRLLPTLSSVCKWQHG